MVFERRASAILFNILRARADTRPVLLPANICPIVPETLLEAAQPFELVDIEEPGMTIDRRRCAELLRGRDEGYAGLLFARPYGSERDPTPFFTTLKAAQPDLLVIDDRCLCRPDCDGGSVSPLADVTLFSTGYAKYVDVGIGGFAHLGESIIYRRQQGAFASWLGLSQPDTSWEHHRLRTIEAVRRADEHRQALDAIYADGLPPEIQWPSEFQTWRFNIQVPAPDALLASIQAAGLFASRHYAALGDVFGGGTFPVAERLHAGIVNLFHDRHFDEWRARRVVDVVLRHLEIARPGAPRD